MMAIVFFVAVGVLIGVGLVGPGWAAWAYRKGRDEERELAALRCDQAITAARRTWVTTHVTADGLYRPDGDAWDAIVLPPPPPFDWERHEARAMGSAHGEREGR